MVHGLLDRRNPYQLDLSFLEPAQVAGRQDGGPESELLSLGYALVLTSLLSLLRHSIRPRTRRAD